MRGVAVVGIVVVVAAAGAWWWRVAGGGAPSATVPDPKEPIPLASTPSVAARDVRRGAASEVPGDVPAPVPVGWSATAVLDTPGAAFLTLAAHDARDGQADAAAMMKAAGCPETPVQQGASLVWACPASVRGDGLQVTLTPGAPATMSVVWRRRAAP